MEKDNESHRRRAVRTPPKKVTFVVGQRKFFMDRRIMAQGSLYFRAMLEGQFAESRSNRVELHGISHPQVFKAFLDYTFKKRQNFVRHVPYLAEALDLADMYCQDDMADRVKEHLLDQWQKASNMQDVVDIADRVGRVKWDILRMMFGKVSCAFYYYGFRLAAYRNRKHHSVDCLRILTIRISLLLSFFQLEECVWFCFSDAKGENNFFAKGVLTWALKSGITADQVFHITRCLRLEYFRDPIFQDLLFSLPDADLLISYQKQLELARDLVQRRIRDAVSQICLCYDSEDFVIYFFDLEQWRWKEERVSITDRNYQSFDSTKSVCFSLNPYSFSLFIDADSQQANFRHSNINCLAAVKTPWTAERVSNPSVIRNNVLQQGRGPMFFSGIQNNVDSKRNSEIQVYMFQQHLSKKEISVLGRIEGLKEIRGCQVIRVGDVLHGFVCHSPDGKGTNMSHFLLDVGRVVLADHTPEAIDMMDLQTLPTYVPVGLFVKAAAVTSSGILLFFICEEKYFWLARYDTKYKDLESLGFLPECPFIKVQIETHYHDNLAGGSINTLFRFLCYFSGNV